MKLYLDVCDATTDLSTYDVDFICLDYDVYLPSLVVLLVLDTLLGLASLHQCDIIFLMWKVVLLLILLKIRKSYPLIWRMLLRIFNITKLGKQNK